MVTREGEAATTSDREIVLSRVYDAPREVVWRAWTELQHLARWWGPDGFATTTHEIDVRPGGVWRFIMHGPDGTDYNNRIIYREVTAPERLLYAHDDDGEGASGQFVTEVAFAEQDGKTEVTMCVRFASKAERDRHIEENGAIVGGKQTLARLAAYLAEMEKP
jgi:uncharacterized protein YndB with AHSA1/START domain